MLVDGERDARYTLVLAHGAGLGMDSRFLDEVAAALAARGASAGGIRIVRFEFSYMARARARGRRQRPDPMPALVACYRDVLATLGVDPLRLLLAGKSLGARVASHVAAEIPPAALVCFGYPFHPPRDRGRLRVAPLLRLAVPALICQGTRDPFGNADDVASYALPESIRVVWIPDGDHDFVPRKRSGRTTSENRAMAADAVVAFLGALGGVRASSRHKL